MTALASRRALVAVVALACLAAGATAWRGGAFDHAHWSWRSSDSPGTGDARADRSSNPYLAATLHDVPPAYSLEPTASMPMTALEVAAGDFNGDGREDVAVLAAATGLSAFDVRLFLQHPDGSLAESTSYRVPGPAGEGAGMAAGDLNEDGRDDVVVTHRNLGDFQYMLSQPGGGFAWRVEEWTHLSPVGSPRIADLDTDGHLDVIVPLRLFSFMPGAESGRFVTSFGDGAGGFFRHAWAVAGDRASIAVGRLDGDPYPDLLAADSSVGEAPALLWRNAGSGDWLPPATLEPMPAGAPYVAAIVADLTGEGRPDAVLQVSGGVLPRFHVYPQSATGELASTPLAYFARDHTTRLLAPDLDGNGRHDLLQLDDMHLHYYLQDELGLGYPQEVQLGIDQQPLYAHGMAAADFNGDGVVDVAIATHLQGLIILRGALRPYTGPGGLPGAPSVVQLEDIDGGDDTHSVAVTLLPPAENGGTPITGYTVYSVPGGGRDYSAGSTSTVHVIGGLEEQVPYVFFARASNAAGFGPPSAPTQPLTLVPGALPELVNSVEYGYEEGNFGINTIEVRYRSDRAADGVSFRLSTAGGSAEAGSDYLPASAVLHFPKGSRVSEPLRISILGDLANEEDELVQINLSELQGATVVNPVTSFTINNDDPVGPHLVIGDVEVIETNQGSVVASVPVKLTQAQATAVTYDIRTAWPIGATPGVDYDELALVGQTIPAGQTTGEFRVTVHGDTRVEELETIVVELANVQGAGLWDGLGSITIVDDEAPPTLSVSDLSVVEGDEAPNFARFTATLSAPMPRDIYFSAVPLEGSAKAGSDFVSSYIGSVTLRAGATATDIFVRLLPDRQLEPDETFRLRLEGGHGFVIADAEATATIVNDDLPNTLSVSDATVDEGGVAHFTVVLSEPAAAPVVFDASTSNGTASSAMDYAASQLDGLVIPAGSTTLAIDVQTLEDAEVEANETFQLNLGNAHGASIRDGQGLGRISNDDLAVLSISDISVVEGDSGLTGASFTVRLSSPMPSRVRFGISTAVGGTASGGNFGFDDHRTSARMLTLDPGRTWARFEVAVVGDTEPEADETFFVRLLSAEGAILGDSTAVGTIVNDDFGFSLPVAPRSRPSLQPARPQHRSGAP